jgi:hypothetical protein
VNWVIYAVLTGKMPKMSAKDRATCIQDFSKLGREAKDILIAAQQKEYAARKASGLDNAQKNAAVMANVAMVAAGVFALITSDVQFASTVLIVVALVLMTLAIIIAYVMFSPKYKNWVSAKNNENTSLSSLERLKAATQGMDALLLFIYMEAVDGEFHWNHLLLLERREFGLVCVLSIIGLVLTAIAVVA